MGVAVTVFNGTEQFEQIPSTESFIWNLVKIRQAVSEKTFKDYIILYHIYSLEARADKPGGQNFACTWTV